MADNTGAAFGVFPQMRPRRARQDREAAANAPLSLLRGWAAGTAGLPGDIEGLLRMLTPGVSNEPALPTSEFYKEWLPGRSLNETPTGRAFTDAGSLTGGAGLGPLSRVAAGGARVAGRQGAELLMRAAERGSPLTAGFAPMNVIKPKGGNWLAGSVEESLKGLKQPLFPGRLPFGDDANAIGAAIGQTPEEVLRAAEPRSLAINNWIDKQLKNYVQKDMATPEDPIRALAEKWAVDKPAKLAEVQGRIDALGAKIDQTAGQRGVPPEYLTSMRQQMIGLEKQKEQIQLRDALHIPQEDLINAGRWPPEELGASRRMAGFPEMGVVEDKAGLYGEMNPYQMAAGGWEVLSDAALNASAAGKHTLPLTESEIRRSYLSNVDKNPWLLKVPPETPVYYPEKSLPEELGFNHLIDELRNAVNPESGLPRELLLKYKDLPKITVPQAVQRVADINAWRAAQKAEADLARANNAATVLHKEYPEKGMKWVELAPPKDLTSGVTLEPKAGGFDIVGPNGEDIGWAKTKQEAIRISGQHKALEDALKYEGDTMGHCVGGYCPDVIEGKSRIYSLRDAKGQPHVTVEVQPGRLSGKMNLEDWAARYEETHGQGSSASYLAKHPEIEQAFVPEIKQIKGKANRAPNPEYLPFVQDFVKSGQWSDVGDLQNTELLRLRDFEGRMHPELMKRAREKFGDYATQTEMEALHAPSPDNPMPGFAAGGLVQNTYNQAKIDALAQQLQEELYA
jgi:hypothetical protein